MKPYYKVESDIEIIINGLIEKCIELSIGNCSFDLYNGTSFHMTQYKDYWDLNVITEHDRKRHMDIYKILDNVLIYQYTE